MDFVKMKEIQLEIERGKEMKSLEAWKNILDYHELHLHDRPLDEELGVLQHALNRLEQDDSMREITLKELNRLDKIDSREKPMKIYTNESGKHFCPTKKCGVVIPRKEYKYCQLCGQALDWNK